MLTIFTIIAVFYVTVATVVFFAYDVEVVLPKDDEVWFEVHSPFGNWEFTFERVGY